MAAVFDQASSATNNASASSITWSHVQGNLGGTGLIVVGVGGRSTVSGYANGVVSSVTYNGISMTKVQENGNNGGSNATHVSLWELHGSSVPVAGTYTVVATYTGAIASQASGAMSFKNVQPKVAEASTSTNGNGATTLSTTLTTLTPNALLVTIYGSQNSTAYNSSSTGDTLGFSAQVAASNGETDGLYRTVTIPASSTTTLSVTNPEAEAMCTASFATISAGGAFLFNFL